MSDRPKTAFSIADLCSSDTESDGIEEQIGERVAGSSSSLVNAASIPKTPRSSPVTDENLLQNAAPGYPEGVSQLTSPLFSNAVYMGIITHLTIMAASRVLNASFFALPPATTPSAVIPQPRMDHVLPVAVHAQNRKGCKKSNNPLHHFLLDLLRSGEHKDIIQWTNGSSFKLIDPEAVATLWGELNGNATMNYEKMSRGLRYYYGKGIMEKVNGEKYSYRFMNTPENSESS